MEQTNLSHSHNAIAKLIQEEVQVLVIPKNYLGTVYPLTLTSTFGDPAFGLSNVRNVAMRMEWTIPLAACYLTCKQ